MTQYVDAYRIAFGNTPWVGQGVSGFVFPIAENVVAKHPFDDVKIPEHIIYSRLGSHPRITKVVGVHETVLFLERLPYNLREVLIKLKNQERRVEPERIMLWSKQIVEALGYIHSCHVMQVDIGPHNMLLDDEENLKLVDFAGCSIDGSSPSVYAGGKFRHPDLCIDNPSLQSELFALGSSLYEIETTRQPYHDRESKDIEELYRAGTFPDTSQLMLGDVIQNCWRLKYGDIANVDADISHAQQILMIRKDGAATEEL